MALRRSFIFIGAPGVGKGTFAKEICKRKELNLYHFSMGDEIRKEIKKGSFLGKTFSSFVENGHLVPDNVSLDFAFESIESLHKDQNFILDGFPRNLFQAKAIKRHFNSSQNREFVPIFITQDQDVTIRKLLGRQVCEHCHRGFNSENIFERGYEMPALLPDTKNCPMAEKYPNLDSLAKGITECQPILHRRADDTREVIAKRFVEFEEKTSPLLNFFSHLNEQSNSTCSNHPHSHHSHHHNHHHHQQQHVHHATCSHSSSSSSSSTSSSLDPFELRDESGRWLNLRTFEVKRGVMDTDKLLELMMK